MLRWGPWTEEVAEEGLHGCLWLGEEGEAELSCDGEEEEEEGGHHEKEVEVALRVGRRENIITQTASHAPSAEWRSHDLRLRP